MYEKQCHNFLHVSVFAINKTTCTCVSAFVTIKTKLKKRDDSISQRDLKTHFLKY